MYEKNNQPNLLNNDCGVKKPPSGPSDYCMRQHLRQRNFKDFKKNAVTTKTAKFKRICLCSVLTHNQIETLKLKGMICIVVNEPVQRVDGNVKVVYQSLDETSIHILSDLYLSKSNVCVVTTYNK